MNDAMQVRITKAATKELNRIGPSATRIREKIRQFAADPASLQSNVKALKGSDTYRLRIGDHRVIFTLSGGTMTVLAVRKRDEAYG